MGFLLFLATVSLVTNPFFIEFSSQEELTPANWEQVQNTLRSIDIAPTLHQIYPSSIPKKFWFQKSQIKKEADFLGRISRGLKQTLISTSEGKIPSKQLIQINKGGDCCIVSFASYDGVYTEHLQTLVKDLEGTGFHGHVLLMKGGFPNPTGEEIQYAGIPYCFKIFALLEAKKLGFSKALWIDAALKPLQSPEPIFDKVATTGSFFEFHKNGQRYLLPYTHQVLLQETGIDMYNTLSVRARVIGLNFEAPHIQEFLKEYYRLVRLGTPFLSCFPEEHVLGAILAQSPNLFPPSTFKNLVQDERKLKGKSPEQARKNGSFFLLRKH
jgi:hypothetical protein